MYDSLNIQSQQKTNKQKNFEALALDGVAQRGW